MNLNSFFSLMHDFKEVNEWQVEIGKKNNDPYEIDELKIYLSLNHGANHESSKKEINKAIFDQVGVNADLIIEDRQSIIQRLGLETELKEKRIMDLRMFQT